jgi:hypothetical protein
MLFSRMTSVIWCSITFPSKGNNGYGCVGLFSFIENSWIVFRTMLRDYRRRSYQFIYKTESKLEQNICSIWESSHLMCHDVTWKMLRVKAPKFLDLHNYIVALISSLQYLLFCIHPLPSSSLVCNDLSTMRLLRPLLGVLSFILISTNLALAQDVPFADGPKEKHTFQVCRRLHEPHLWHSVNMSASLERCCPPARHCYQQVRINFKLWNWSTIPF